MSSEFETDESGVVVISRAQLRNKALSKRSGPGRRKRWYERAGVTRVGNDQAPVRKLEWVIHNGDLVLNNGSIVLDREGQTAVVIAVNHEQQVADVIGPDGPVTWVFREINRTVAGQRSDS